MTEWLTQSHKCSPSVTPATFHGFHGHVWAVATTVERADIEHFHHWGWSWCVQGGKSSSRWELLQSRFKSVYRRIRDSQVALVVKNLPANAGDLRDVGSIPGLGRSSGEGNGNPVQYSCFNRVLDMRIPWTEEPGRLQSMGLQSWTRLKSLSAYAQKNSPQTRPVQSGARRSTRKN